MGYHLQAFICKNSDSNLLAEPFDKVKAIELGKDLTLIPMTEELYDQINSLVVSDSVSKFAYLTEHIESQVLKFIGNAKVAYIEADYFGGQGGQMAIIWKNNKREYFVEYGQDCINEVLKIFGIKARLFADEFDTLGLGRHRNTIDWLEDN